MSIPQLESCCCGCTLRTGTKIIGWLSLIGGILSVIGAAATIPALYQMEEDPKVPESTKEILPVLRGVAIVQVIFYLFQTIVSILLLMGAYQNKGHYILWWIYTSLFVLILGLLAEAVSFFIVFHSAVLIGMIIGTAISLYLILVVYSFYREVQNGPGNYA